MTIKSELCLCNLYSFSTCDFNYFSCHIFSFFASQAYSAQMNTQTAKLRLQTEVNVHFIFMHLTNMCFLCIKWSRNHRLYLSVF